MNLGQVIADSGGRRFCMTIGAGLISTTLLINGYLTESAYITLQLATVGVYIAANTAQKYTNARYNNGEK